MSRSHFTCQSCGSRHPRWVGHCEACGEWNSVVEEAGPGGTRSGRRHKPARLESLQETSSPPERLVTGIGELDRVFGGGLVPGSALLLGGDPGIGKSTLALQIAAKLSLDGAHCIYFSGEEATEQVRLRAFRLNRQMAPMALSTGTGIAEILATLSSERPALAIIDSIQTMHVDGLDSAPGTIGQVRGAGQELIGHAKRSGVIVLLIGHVTKEGQIAGPKVLEHMVDTVLYFEGERGHQFRILRAVKNRFGPTDEIGVFEMTDGGLEEVANPSALFLDRRSENVAGTVVFAGMEGSRPMLMEIQALAAPSRLGTPRRTVVGWDSGRLAMVLAVLDTRCGMAMSGHDVYLNVAGGLAVREPAADLAVATALISSLKGEPVAHDTVVFGEVGLTGEIRPVHGAEQRLSEAGKLGFTSALVPRARGAATTSGNLSIHAFGDLESLADHLTGTGSPS